MDSHFKTTTIHPDTAHPAPTAPDRRLTLRTNFGWALAGNALFAACQWGILVAFSKLGSTEMAGQYALALAWATPVFMLANLQLRAVQATDVNRQHSFGVYLALRLATTLLSLGFIALLMPLTGSGHLALVILIVASAKAGESIGDVFHGLFQRQERLDRVAISQMLKGVLGLGLLVVALHLTGEILWGVAGLCAAWLLVLFLYDWPNAQRAGQGRPLWDKEPMRELAQTAWPLGLVMGLLALNTSLPRIVIERQLGLHELGIFAALSYFMMIDTMAVAALGQAATPRLAQSFADGHIAEFRALLRRLLLIAACLGAGMMLLILVAGRPLLAYLYRPEYAAYLPVLLWLMLASWLSDGAQFLGYGLTATRCFRAQAPLFTLCCVTNGVACLLLVPAFGLTGAAWASLLSTIVQLAGSKIILETALRRPTSTTLLEATT